MIGCFNILNPKFSAAFFLWDLCLFFQLSRGGSGEGSGVVVNRDYFVRFFVNFLRWFLNFFIFRRGGWVCGLKFNHEYVNALETFFLKNQLSDYLLALKREGFSRWILYFFFNRRISNVLFLTQKKFDFGVESQKKKMSGPENLENGELAAVPPSEELDSETLRKKFNELIFRHSERKNQSEVCKIEHDDFFSMNFLKLNLKINMKNVF